MVKSVIATSCELIRRIAIAAIDGITRRIRCLLPRHASECDRSRDLLDEHLDNRPLRGPGDVDHVLVELGDAVALLPDILDHELVDLTLDERRLLDLGRLLDGLHGPTRAAGITLEHRDPAFLDEPRVRPPALLTEDVRLHVGLDPVLDLLRRDIAFEIASAALQGS